MLQKYSKYRIVQEFFDKPRTNFQMREISRRTGITQPSVVNNLKALAKEKFILREKKGLYPTYRANRDNDLFKLHKKFNIICRLHKCGLLDLIYDNCMPDTIILFGSASKGEDTEESDIDLFIQSPEKKFNLEKYEKLLNRKIAFFFEEDFSKLSNELKNNIINGTVLKGYLKVF
jgi:predicted nucleotidyltransferase